MFKYISKIVFNLIQGAFKVGTQKISLERPNYQRSEFMGKPDKIVLHWTAGNKKTLYDDYHYNITEIDGEGYVFQTLKLTEKGQHLWGRNSGSVGITLCCKSIPTDLPTEKMIDAAAVLVAELCCWKNLNIKGKITLEKKTTKRVGKELILYNVPGSISVDVVSDHAAYARLDNYYPDRWDIEKYLPIIKAKAETYYTELKAGKRTFQFKDIIK